MEIIFNHVKASVIGGLSRHLYNNTAFDWNYQLTVYYRNVDDAFRVISIYPIVVAFETQKNKINENRN